MRPRDGIDKRKNLYLTMVAISFSALVLLAFSEKYMSATLFKPLLYSALTFFVGGNIFLYVGIRCPKCKATIGYHIVFSAGKADRCPRCRIHFDEDIV